VNGQVTAGPRAQPSAAPTKGRATACRAAWWRPRGLAALLAVALWPAALVGVAACGESAPAVGGARIADVAMAPSAAGTASTADVDRSADRSEDRSTVGNVGVAALARAAGGADGTVYTVGAVPTPGVIIGHVGGGAPRDTSITPTHNLGVCRPFSESIVASRDGGVGNAVVWLMGVSRGPRDTAPRRVKLTLDGCRLAPRVQRAARGSTIMISGRDAMLSRLQFTAAGESASRTTVLLSDAGQMVPTGDATGAPGLVQVTDDMHPWVRAWIVVGPHPFVAITEADGRFRFDGVPPGRYTLVTWHERFGIKTSTVRVDGAVQTRVAVEF